jgi:hypothetical protein
MNEVAQSKTESRIWCKTEDTKMNRAMKLLGVVLAMAVLSFAPFPVALAAGVTPSVTVGDQPILSGRVMISKVVSDGPGWLTIHNDKNGNFDKVIGYTSVNAGDNSGVVVAVDLSLVTPVLYAMLHTDVGKIGVYEFPGPDVPAMADGKIVSPPFKVIDWVNVEPQAVKDNRVTIKAVFSETPGWMVIHADKAGQPGAVIGWTPVAAGANWNVSVAIDPSKATATLYAMLHVDLGKLGVYEFPGPDVPTMVNGKMASPPFKVTGLPNGS